MFYIKQCKCGSFEFDLIDDTLRCAVCERLVIFQHRPDKEIKEERTRNKNETVFQKDLLVDFQKE